ncbi:hypothetical protein HJC23_001892 [Cyclotella cryptica]|uniref:Uncharacterized protein n=1 Tax=Cyclotella cryptica TaxID=29204 RepID=A0ABD3PKQ7_9STRA
MKLKKRLDETQTCGAKTSRTMKSDAQMLNLQALQYPLMCRVNQHFIVDEKFRVYNREISRLSALSKEALASIISHEQRLRELFLRPKTPPYKEKTSGLYQESSTPRSIAKGNTAQVGLDEDEYPDVMGCTHDCDLLPRAKVRVAEVTCTSFTLEWESLDQDLPLNKLDDVEIRYFWTVSNIENCVVQSCLRWCLKDPVPNGRVRIDNLETNMEYRNVSLRFKNGHGWGDFSAPMTIFTSELTEDYRVRRSQFMHRIDCIKESIERLKELRSAIPSKQTELTQNMIKMQNRMSELAFEAERVVATDENDIVASHVIHGSRQSFAKSDLQQKLQLEYVAHRKKIAQCRSDIISLNQNSSDLNARVEDAVTTLSLVKARLLKLDRQHAIVHGLKKNVSKRSPDLMDYYFASWRTTTKSILNVKKMFSALEQCYRRQKYLAAWLKLRKKVSEQGTRPANTAGIGENLIVTAEACVEENLIEATYLACDLLATRSELWTTNDDNKEVLDDLMSNEERVKYLMRNDDVLSLVKGCFLFQAGKYRSSLKFFEVVASKMASLAYFDGINEKDAITIYSALMGKMAQAYSKLELWDVAILYLNRQMTLAKEISLEECQTAALIGLGKCYCAKFDFEYAYGLFQEALDTIVSKENSAKEAVVYSWIEKCLLNMNRPKEAAKFAAKIHQARDKRKEHVDAALLQIAEMKQRLINITAKTSRVLNLEVASAHLILLKREKAAKEKILAEMAENLSKSTGYYETLVNLESKINFEIEKATTTKKNRMVSRLIQGTSQEIKTAELMRRLRENLAVSEKKKNLALQEKDRLSLLIHNVRDEISQIDRNILLEYGPLMQRVLKKRNYRCMALNSLNVARNDVCGISKGCVELIASSEGKELYLHNIKTGKLEYVFNGCEAGRHVGEIHGHTSTITALCFHGNNVYTGGLDSCVICWDTVKMKMIFVGRGHFSAVSCIFADSFKLVSGSADRTIILWDKVNGCMLQRIQGHVRGVHHVHCCSIPNSHLEMVSASFDTVYCWRRDRSSMYICQQRFRLPQGDVTALQYGELEVITGDNKGYLSLFWVDTGNILKSLKVHEGPITSLQVDATKAVSCGLDMVVQIVDVIRWEIIQSLRGHLQAVHDVAFDSRCIMSLSIDGEIRFWEWADQ